MGWKNQLKMENIFPIFLNNYIVPFAIWSWTSMPIP